MKASSKKMRTGAILLVVALVVSCVAGGTLAKYVTEGEATDSARVAKWGVTVEAVGEPFKKAYTNEDNAVTVDSSVDVVAPGTRGSFEGIRVNADAPEVSYKVATTADVTIENWMVDDNFYCPLKFNVCGTEIDGMEYESADDLVMAIENAVVRDTSYSNFENNAGATHNPNSDQYAGRYSWEWPFEGGSDGNATEGQNDTKDTALGQLLADGNEGNDPTINIIVKTTVTQID